MDWKPSNQKELIWYLRGLFDGDGSIMNDRDDYWQISYATGLDEELRDWVSQQLTLLHINHRSNEEHRKQKVKGQIIDRTYYRIMIRRQEEVERFLRNIGFILNPERKIIAQEAIIDLSRRE
jgi:hypothetical protein